MVCDVCGKEGARTRRVSRSYGKGESLYLLMPALRLPPILLHSISAS